MRRTFLRQFGQASLSQAARVAQTASDVLRPRKPLPPLRCLNGYLFRRGACTNIKRVRESRCGECGGQPRIRVCQRAFVCVFL